MNPEAIITMTNLKGDIKTVKVSDLLPFGFDEGDLNAK
jgi:cytidine deaminase